MPLFLGSLSKNHFETAHSYISSKSTPSPNAELPLSGFGRQLSISMGFAVINRFAVSRPHEVSYFSIR